MSSVNDVTIGDMELERAEIEEALSKKFNGSEEEKGVPVREGKKAQKKDEKRVSAKEENGVQGSLYPAGYGEMMTICVPKDKLNPSDDIIPVHINEFSWRIVRGEPVSVPKAVYDVLHAGEYL